MTWIRDRALTLALVAMFLVFLVGQLFTGFAEYNDEQAQHGQAAVVMTDYLATGHPWEALFENWESEFLQMAAFVLLTTFLVQKGSPESRRPGVKELVDSDPRDFADHPDAPWPVRRGGWILLCAKVGAFMRNGSDADTQGLDERHVRLSVRHNPFWFRRPPV